jgi:hypothetical protein
MNRLFPFVLGLAFVASACAQGKPVKDDDDAAARAEDLTTQYHLTPIKLDCLYFDTDDEGKDWLVRVRTKQGGECGGDPDVTQTVFFMKLRKSDGHPTTTAYNLDGKFEELKAVPASSASSGRK